MWNNQKQLKLFSLMSNWQTYYHFKLDFQKVDQHAGGTWLIHGNTNHWELCVNVYKGVRLCLWVDVLFATNDGCYPMSNG